MALGVRLDPEADLMAWDVERLYRAVDDRRMRRVGPRAASTRALARTDAADLKPAEGTRGAPEDEAGPSREWCERLQRAHAGDGAHSMLRTLLADLPRPRTPWEQALRAQLAHGLAQLAEPPEKFHDRHRLARWGVVARRAIQSLTVVLMVAGASLLPQLTDASSAGLWMALHYVPIGLLAVSFSLQELAQLEIPPWPRRSRARQWNERLTTEADPAR